MSLSFMVRSRLSGFVRGARMWLLHIRVAIKTFTTKQLLNLM